MCTLKCTFLVKRLSDSRLLSSPGHVGEFNATPYKSYCTSQGSVLPERLLRMIVLVVVPVEAELVVADGQVPLDLVHVVVDDLAVIVIVGLVFVFVVIVLVA